MFELGHIAAGISANLAMLDVIKAWEEKNLLEYGRAVMRVFETVSREDLESGVECNGWRFWLDTETVGSPLKLVRIQ